MKYRTAPGVILTSVCGKFFLVTPKEALQINETTALYWKRLEKESSAEELLALAKENYEIEDPEEIRNDIRDMLSSMFEKHLLVRCDS